MCEDVFGRRSSCEDVLCRVVLVGAFHDNRNVSFEETLMLNRFMKRRLARAGLAQGRFNWRHFVWKYIF